MLTPAQSRVAPPEGLSFGSVRLRFDKVVSPDSATGLAPYYHFRVLLADDTDVGHINFRIGNTDHILITAGHIGYEIREEHRGHNYAFEACRAIGPFVRSLYSAVTITCDPHNYASRRTIEKLGTTFIDEIEVPRHDPGYLKGGRRKRRYEWRP